jgi:hypothetical protein
VVVLFLVLKVYADLVMHIKKHAGEKRAIASSRSLRAPQGSYTDQIREKTRYRSAS